MYFKKMILSVIVSLSVSLAIDAQTIDQNTSIGKITSYETQEVQVLKTQRSDETVLFFEKTIRWGVIGFYCFSEIGIVKDVGAPRLSKDLKELSPEIPLLLLNGHRVNLSQSNLDFYNLLPVSVSSFNFGKDRFIMINYNLFSFIGTSGWSYILLKIDEVGKVSKEYYFESQEKLQENDLGDFNGDGKLDYVIRYKTQDLKKNVKYSRKVVTIGN